MDSKQHLAKMRHYQSERDRGRILIRLDEDALKEAEEAVKKAEQKRAEAHRALEATKGWTQVQAGMLAHHTDHYLDALAKESAAPAQGWRVVTEAEPAMGVKVAALWMRTWKGRREPFDVALVERRGPRAYDWIEFVDGIDTEANEQTDVARPTHWMPLPETMTEESSAPATPAQAALDAARDEIDRLRRTIEENAHEMARVRRSAADSVEVVRGAHAESARLRGSVAGWLYVVEDALERDAAGQARALTLMRDQMRMALAGQQRLIAEARALRGSAEPTPGQTEGADGH